MHAHVAAIVCMLSRRRLKMYQKKTGINYMRTVNAVTSVPFKFLLHDFDD